MGSAHDAAEKQRCKSLSQNESSQLFQTCSPLLATPHILPFVSHPSLANPTKHPVRC